MEKKTNLEDTIKINKAVVLVLPTDSVIRINNIELKPGLNDDLTQTYILDMPTAEDFLTLDKLIADGYFTVECPRTDNPFDSVVFDSVVAFPYYWSKTTHTIKAYINQERSILDPHEIKETNNYLSAILANGSITIQIRDRDSLIIDLNNIRKEEEEDGE